MKSLNTQTRVTHRARHPQENMENLLGLKLRWDRLGRGNMKQERPAQGTMKHLKIRNNEIKFILREKIPASVDYSTEDSKGNLSGGCRVFAGADSLRSNDSG